jgi:hypothetical protein
MSEARQKPQISPLRYAPVEMTILFGNAGHHFQEELSSRPERSAVERSAVFLPRGQKAKHSAQKINHQFASANLFPKFVEPCFILGRRKETLFFLTYVAGMGQRQTNVPAVEVVSSKSHS